MGKPSKWGEAGEVVVRTDKGVNPGMFLGYFRDEETDEPRVARRHVSHGRRGVEATRKATTGTWAARTM